MARLSAHVIFTRRFGEVDANLAKVLVLKYIPTVFRQPIANWLDRDSIIGLPNYQLFGEAMGLLPNVVDTLDHRYRVQSTTLAIMRTLEDTKTYMDVLDFLVNNRLEDLIQRFLDCWPDVRRNYYRDQEEMGHGNYGERERGHGNYGERESSHGNHGERERGHGNYRSGVQTSWNCDRTPPNSSLRSDSNSRQYMLHSSPQVEQALNNLSICGLNIREDVSTVSSSNNCSYPEEPPRQSGEPPRQSGESPRQSGESPRQSGEPHRQSGEPHRQGRQWNPTDRSRQGRVVQCLPTRGENNFNLRENPEHLPDNISYVSNNNFSSVSDLDQSWVMERLPKPSSRTTFVQSSMNQINVCPTDLEGNQGGEGISGVLQDHLSPQNHPSDIAQTYQSCNIPTTVDDVLTSVEENGSAVTGHNQDDHIYRSQIQCLMRGVLSGPQGPTDSEQFVFDPHEMERGRSLEEQSEACDSEIGPSISERDLTESVIRQRVLDHRWISMYQDSTDEQQVVSRGPCGVGAIYRHSMPRSQADQKKKPINSTIPQLQDGFNTLHGQPQGIPSLQPTIQVSTMASHHQHNHFGLLPGQDGPSNSGVPGANMEGIQRHTAEWIFKTNLHPPSIVSSDTVTDRGLMFILIIYPDVEPIQAPLKTLKNDLTRNKIPFILDRPSGLQASNGLLSKADKEEINKDVNKFYQKMFNRASFVLLLKQDCLNQYLNNQNGSQPNTTQHKFRLQETKKWIAELAPSRRFLYINSNGLNSQKSFDNVKNIFNGLQVSTVSPNTKGNNRPRKNGVSQSIIKFFRK